MPEQHSSLPEPSADSTLADSAGFWLFLFAIFALISLSVGESKIQKRMQIYHHRVTGGGQKGDLNKIEVSAVPDDRIKTPVNKEPDYIYSLRGLRWIFGALTLVGLILMGWPYLRQKQPSNSHGE